MTTTPWLEMSCSVSLPTLERSLPRKRPSLSWRSSVNLRMMMVSCPSSPSSRGCALLRSKKPTCSLARKNKDNSTFRTSLDFVEFWQLKIREKQKPGTHHRGSFMKPKLLLWNNFNFLMLRRRRRNLYFLKCCNLPFRVHYWSQYCQILKFSEHVLCHL